MGSETPPLNPLQKETIKTMLEAELQTMVVQLAQTLGYAVFHPRAVESVKGRWLTAISYDGKGFPDLVLVGRGQVLFRELKSTRGRLGPHQKAWLQVLDQAGANTGVWRPADWFSGVIHQQLEGK